MQRDDLPDIEPAPPLAPSRPARQLRPLPRGGPGPVPVDRMDRMAERALMNERVAARALASELDAIAGRRDGNDAPSTRDRGAASGKAARAGLGRSVQMLEV